MSAVLFALAALAASTFFAACAYIAERWAEKNDARRFPAPGRLVPLAKGVSSQTIHWNSRGQGSPPVILEAGLAATSLSWALVHDQLAQYAETVAYDRAGLGWSRSVAPRKMSLDTTVDDLSALIMSELGSQRVVLVAHSFGGLLVRAFATKYPEQVLAVVLIDPVSLDGWAGCSENDRKRLALGAKLARRGALLAQFGIVRLCLRALLAGRSRMPRLLARSSAAKGTGLVSRLVGEMSRLPRPMWPAISAHWSRPSSFRVMAEYLEKLPESARAVCGENIPPSIPLAVLSAATAKPEELEERKRWVEQSHRGAHIQVPECSHWIQLGRPEMVVSAVLEILEQARSISR